MSLNPDTIRLEALEAALSRFAEGLAERGLITFEQAACVFASIEDTTEFIPGEHEPEYDPYDDTPLWLMVMEKEMADRIAQIEGVMATLRDLSDEQLKEWFEYAEDRYESQRIEEMERRFGC